MPENRDSAIERWTFLASSAPDVPRRIKAQAHSCLATGWFDRAIEDPEHLNIDSLYRAGSNAGEAISLGLTSPGALRAGFSIESQGFRRPGDNRFPGLSTDRFQRLTELWEAIDERTAEIDKASAKGDGKVKAPLKYACSAEDCGIQATKKLGLLRCAGKCPVVFKPSYCSKECQKIVCRFPPALSLPIQSCLPRRTGNGTNRFVKPTPQSQACSLSMPTMTPQKITSSRRGAGVPNDIPRQRGRRR